MHTSGGRVSITVNGVVYSARGEIKLDKSSLSVDVGTNQDGTIYKTIKPQPRMAECTFDRFVDANGIKLQFDETLMLMNNIAATFIEKDTGITHLLTNGTFVGNPSENLGSGEVDGVKFAAEDYTSLT
jgi:hypothetical protein